MKDEIYNTAYEEQETTIKRAIKSIKDYVIDNNLHDFKRKDIELFYPNLPQTAIKKALQIMEQDGYIKSEGNTNNRIFMPISPDFKPNTI